MAADDLSRVLDDPRKMRLIEWLCTPKGERCSQLELGVELGVADRTLRHWQAEPQVRAVWERDAKRAVGDPGKVQEVIESLRRGAIDRSESLSARVRAADVYLKAVDGIRPPVVDVASKKAAELSDGELRAFLAQAAQTELLGRES